MACELCNGTKKVWNGLLGEMRGCPNCGEAGIFLHVTPKADACDHDFTGWRDFEDGNGGEQVCSKCGTGAMSYSLRTGF